MLRQLLAVLVVPVVASCHQTPATIEPIVTPARVAPSEAAVSCSEWVQRALAAPELDVEKVPEPVAYNPAPIPKKIPPGVVPKNKTAEVRIKVMVDTLGKADMATFTVVRSTHVWLTRNVRAAVAKWKFRPAEIDGCKVPRLFNWSATAK
jgi:hypothetical protein